MHSCRSWYYIKFTLFSASEEIPKSLLDQLAFGGRMVWRFLKKVIPVGKQNNKQLIYIVDKDLDGNITKTADIEVVYFM